VTKNTFLLRLTELNLIGDYLEEWIIYRFLDGTNSVLYFNPSFPFFFFLC